MPEKPSLLIVDRNPNVREYLKRELGVEGYRIRLAENCRDMFRLISAAERIDLVIIDPDLPDVEGVSLFRKLEGLRPRVPVLIHTLVSDFRNRFGFPNEAQFIEKDGNSIDRLKHEIDNLLQGRLSSSAPLQPGSIKAGRSHLSGACKREAEQYNPK